MLSKYKLIIFPLRNYSKILDFTEAVRVEDVVSDFGPGKDFSTLKIMNICYCVAVEVAVTFLDSFELRTRVFLPSVHELSHNGNGW